MPHLRQAADRPAALPVDAGQAKFVNEAAAMKLQSSRPNVCRSHPLWPCQHGADAVTVDPPLDTAVNCPAALGPSARMDTRAAVASRMSR